MSPSLPPATGQVHRYRTRVTWSGSTGAGYETYDRRHTAVTVPPTAELALSADPSFRGDADRLDPEQLLVTAAASCQLLSFLAVAARARLDVVGYRDDAEAEMPADERPVRITRILLRPHVTLAAGADEAKVRRLIDVAHRECYIANSLRSEIVISPTISVIDDTPYPAGS
jgi:organic hydroperoxide reductase OsmC/OhrA